MEPLKLTKEQEKKLLEMAITLFPEYGEPQFLYYILNPIDNRKESISPVLRWYRPKEENFKLLEIHWFEFCIYHLAPLIERKANDMYNTELAWINFLQANSGIDYLYEQFKQLK